VVRNTSQAQRSMGLCPQFDTLVERLTVRENLLFFGKIKGLSSHDLVPVTEAFLKAMNIKRYENKVVQQLSGGNRRKVSLAVALMGAPPTVYLDEPSTGLDPVASRLMWRLLSAISSAKTSAIVLTTHNMLECEAVCTRVCIMKLGQMVCLGDSQHLRYTHGTGFQLETALKEGGSAEEVKKVSRHPNASMRCTRLIINN
jgi:ATP-binding cassette subfamily A (ABC1) protein 3